VVLVPGPDDELSIVREISDAFTSMELTESQIAQLLNSKGLQTDLSRDWTRGVVHQMLTNPKYMGSNADRLAL